MHNVFAITERLFLVENMFLYFAYCCENLSSIIEQQYQCLGMIGGRECADLKKAIILLNNSTGVLGIIGERLIVSPMNV